MKIKDYIIDNLQKYPPIFFEDSNYESCKLPILDHIFFTIGNGLELAQTEIESEGGYIVEPKYKRNKEGDYVRKNDKPYGKVKSKPLPKDFFKPDPLSIKFKGSDFSPYPISNYSIVSEIYYNDLFLQPDWMEELIFLCKRTLTYFNNQEEYENHTYYPSKTYVNNDLTYFQERFKKEGINGVKELRKIWGYEKKDTVPDLTEVREHKVKNWNKFKNEQIKFLKRFLKKFDKN